MRFVFVHVTRPEEFSDDQECKTNDDVVAQAFEDATTPLHRILRSLVTGTREYASKHDFRNEDAVRALVLIISISVPTYVNNLWPRELFPRTHHGL